MKLKNQELWDKGVANNTDPYGARVYSYAKDWAELMEDEIAAGLKVEDVAKETSRIADTDGITGFMYGCAVAVLSECWEHGDELRRWHNRATQIGDEGDKANESGGVLNPALLNIEFKD